MLKKHLLLFSMLKIVVLLNIFVETMFSATSKNKDATARAF